MEDEKKDFEELTEAVKDAAEEVLKGMEEKLGDKLEDAMESIEDIVEDALEKVDSIDFESKYKETLATMENLRKRLDLEKMDILKYRASSFITNILPTLDMFEMAMSSDNVSEEVRNWLIGFEMILKNFKTTLEAEGVVEISTKPGDEFDSSIHHAIEERESDDIEQGKIVQVKQKGYKLHDRLLRPAAVVVAASKKEEEN